MLAIDSLMMLPHDSWHRWWFTVVNIALECLIDLKHGICLMTHGMGVSLTHEVPWWSYVSILSWKVISCLWPQHSFELICLQTHAHTYLACMLSMIEIISHHAHALSQSLASVYSGYKNCVFTSSNCYTFNTPSCQTTKVIESIAFNAIVARFQLKLSCRWSMLSRQNSTESHVMSCHDLCVIAHRQRPASSTMHCRTKKSNTIGNKHLSALRCCLSCLLLGILTSSAMSCGTMWNLSVFVMW